ncbi:syntabulin isoform X2 [Xiphophorus couchianus]|uniref:syntabulin isoform X2 n=1 Tax=Xiphophorus couchianus TaxID=32473 RepID=UPI00101645F3|nr:syntabulin isoform X2 [Xiphophorus couchianus]XP_027874005.1 syntabulin isoform X2 [Xiphophorus couchianus]
MGPFQEYEEKKSPEKGSPRSRIPRLVLHPFRPKDKGSPLSDSLLSEEEGKECDISSDHSKRTISTNSFCSDDTGCPTSQSVSPSKTPSGSERSAHASPTLPERKAKAKRVRMVAESGGEARGAPRHKREMRSAPRARAPPAGSEADFSSSSSTGSLKTKEILASNSVGKKVSSRCRGPHIRTLPVFKPAGVPSLKHDSELYAPYRTPPRAASSTLGSSCNSSPSSRRVSLGRYRSCEDNHGVRPPNPEQYLTPLQQKEVAIRHLKIKLMESENKVHDRENEIQELKSQLCRMREDWIEEECHRVEAQLSLKEARKEIRQLRQVVETMKNSLMEKDKGIQKYFIDINIQNRKLESLLHSMELAQSGSALQDEGALDFMCDGPEGGDKKLMGEEDGGLEMGNLGAEAMADSGLLVNDEMANRGDIFEQVFMSTAADFSQDSSCSQGLPVETDAGQPAPTEDRWLANRSSPASPPNALSSTVTISSNAPCHQNTDDKEVQTDFPSISADLQALLLQLLKLHGSSLGDAAPPSGLLELPKLPASTVDQSSTSADSGCSDNTKSSQFMEELDFTAQEEKPFESTRQELVDKRYWSNNFLVDLVAVAAPVLPTVAWLYSRHGVDGNAPVYNIGALIRGCCIMGLHSLRRVARRPDA